MGHLIDTEPEAEVLAATWTLLALAHQRTPEDNAADEAAAGWDWDDGTCPECGGELWGKGTLRLRVLQPVSVQRVRRSGRPL